jgi:Transposase DDE domain
MTPDALTDWNEVVARVGGGAALDVSARQCGAMKRSRKVADAASLLRLAFIWGPGGHGFRTTAAVAEAGGIVAMSDVAVLKRLRKAGPWLERLCDGMLAGRIAAPAGVGEQRRVCIVDGTRIAGPGGKAWRLHLGYDLAEGRISGFEVTDLKGGERLDRLEIREGEIRIGDRGYPTPNGLAAVRAAKADFVVRCTWNSLALTHHGKPLHWQRIFETARASGLVDIPVLVGKARRRGWKPVEARLIVIPKPPAAAAQSRCKAREDSRRGQHRLDGRTLLAADFLILITSLPAEQYSANLILQLYRLRWQIEIAIKRLKSLLHMDELRAKSGDLVRVWLLTHLLFALLLEATAAEAAESPP